MTTSYLRWLASLLLIGCLSTAVGCGKEEITVPSTSSAPPAANPEAKSAPAAPSPPP